MFDRLDEFRKTIFHYLEARLELFALETRSRMEEAVVLVVHGLVLILFSMLTLIFLFSLLAAYLNEVFQSRYLGFLVVALFFLMLTIGWALGKDIIKTMIRKGAYTTLLKNQQKKGTTQGQTTSSAMTTMPEGSLIETNP